MNRKYLSIISAPLVAGVVIGGSMLWMNRAAARDTNTLEIASYRSGASAFGSAETQATLRQQAVRSVIKVHTDRGVIALAGSPDSWEQVEEAVFVADSIAEVQLVNNEVGWPVEFD